MCKSNLCLKYEVAIGMPGPFLLEFAPLRAAMSAASFPVLKLCALTHLRVTVFDVPNLCSSAHVCFDDVFVSSFDCSDLSVAWLSTENVISSFSSRSDMKNSAAACIALSSD